MSRRSEPARVDNEATFCKWLPRSRQAEAPNRSACRINAGRETSSLGIIETGPFYSWSRVKRSCRICSSIVVSFAVLRILPRRWLCFRPSYSGRAAMMTPVAAVARVGGHVFEKIVLQQKVPSRCGANVKPGKRDRAADCRSVEETLRRATAQDVRCWSYGCH